MSLMWATGATSIVGCNQATADRTKSALKSYAFALLRIDISIGKIKVFL